MKTRSRVVFEPEEFSDGQGKRRPGEHYQPGNDGNIEMGLAQINAADGHEGQTRQREGEDIAHQVGQVFFPDHSCAAENQGKAEDAGYQEYFIHGGSGRTGCPGGITMLVSGTSKDLHLDDANFLFESLLPEACCNRNNSGRKGKNADSRSRPVPGPSIAVGWGKLH